MNKWIITIEEDPETGDLIIPFTEDILEQAGWGPGDTIIWTDNKDGSYTLTKKEIDNEVHTNC